MNAWDWRLKLTLPVLAAIFVCGCNSKQGPEEIVFGRDACDMCHMTILLPKYAAEIRDGGRHVLNRFDDFGCALKFAAEKSILSDPAAEFWVTDSSESGPALQWIDARKAFYIGGEKTPMDFGFRAQSLDAEGALSFEQIVDLAREKRSRHTGAER